MAKRTSVNWTQPALDSLLEIVCHIKLDNPSAAQRFAAIIKTKVTRLQEFPESGRIVPEFPFSGLREIIVKSYRVIYHIRRSPLKVEILAIRHRSRLLDLSPDQS
ncbi:MAG: type II toxin-antitoxin system RelE/ParE family toxin [Nitrospirales bacterium]